MEDVYRWLDSVLSFITFSRTIFLIACASTSFIITSIAIKFGNSSAINNQRGLYRDRGKLKVLPTFLAITLVLATVLLSMIGVVKATSSYYTPLEYVFSYVFYSLFVLSLLKCKDVVGVARHGAKVILVLAYLSVMLIFVQRIYQTCVHITVTEDTLDILTLVEEGHLERSFHAIHYNVAPLHTFLHVFIIYILNLESLSKMPGSVTAFSMMLSIFLLLYSLSKKVFRGVNDLRFLTLLPAILLVHPYSFGGLVTSHVNSVSLTPALTLLIFLLSKMITENTIMKKEDVTLALILISTSILMHPIGFTVIVISIAAMSLSFRKSAFRKYLHHVLLYALLLFTLKALYTGLKYGLETFLSYVMEALLSQLYRVPTELKPRTYYKLPVTSLYSYTFTLGLFAAILLRDLTRCLRNFFRRRSIDKVNDEISLYNMTIIAITLLLALISYFIVAGQVPSKYIIGNTMPVASICILLELFRYLKKDDIRLLGFLLLTIVILISMLGTLTSPLIMFTHYRIKQGAAPSSDLDYLTASHISSLLEPSINKKFLIFYDATWPYTSALPTLLKWKAVKENLSISTSILSYDVSALSKQMDNLDVIYVGWKTLLAVQ